MVNYGQDSIKRKTMPVIAKLCAVLMLCMLFRCPVIGQRVCARLAAKSFDCTKGNTLIKSLDRSRMLTDQGKTFLSLGVQYNRATTPSSPGALTIERETRVGLPLMAGYRLGKCSLEAGAFVGVNMLRPQESFWFDRPELNSVGRRGGNVDPTATLMLGVGFQFSQDTRLNLRYTHLREEVLSDSVLGNVQLGWSWSL